MVLREQDQLDISVLNEHQSHDDEIVLPLKTKQENNVNGFIANINLGRRHGVANAAMHSVGDSHELCGDVKFDDNCTSGLNSIGSGDRASK